MKCLIQTLGYANNKLKVSLVAALIILLGFGSASFAHTKARTNTATKDSTTSRSKSLLDNLAPKHLPVNYLQPVQVAINPLVAGFVQQYLQKQGKGLESMKDWGKRYFDLYDQILPQYGIPKELKYLSVIESYLQPQTVSWAGAVGPWQLMDYEGKRYGLRMNGLVDERKDFYKSTHAAAKLLRELHDTFGDWLLVLAAYNGGVGRVKQCIKKAHSNSFWDIQYYLPEETRNHVKKYIATHYFFEGSGGWTTMTTAETEKYLASLAIEAKPVLPDDVMNNTTIVEVSGRYLSIVITNQLNVDITLFNQLNPGFDKALAEGKKYTLRLPKEKMPLFEQQKEQLLMQSIRTLLNGNI